MEKMQSEIYFFQSAKPIKTKLSYYKIHAQVVKT